MDAAMLGLQQSVFNEEKIFEYLCVNTHTIYKLGVCSLSGRQVMAVFLKVYMLYA